MSECADYRLRLFQSVDLAGSTAFKAGAGEKPVRNTSQPIWVQKTREFYREFPKLIAQAYAKEVPKLGPNFEGAYPKVWKTVGDEILFCCRVQNPRHLAVCMAAFLSAIRVFGRKLDDEGKQLDLKGSAWVAAFPTPNVTVSVGNDAFTADMFDEEFEAKADATPHEVDFLGNGIDCGFRIARFAATDRCAISVELAWLLSMPVAGEHLPYKFVYHDRHILRGVIKDRPYPITLIDTERNDSRKNVRRKEAALNRRLHVEPEDLHEFLEAFMKDEGLELPIFTAKDRAASDLPQAYVHYRTAWEAEAETERRRTQAEAEAAEATDAVAGTTGELPDEVTSQLSRVVQAAHPEEKDEAAEAASMSSK